MIEVEKVSKRYGAFEAVRDVSFTVDGEQVLGFLGPNGAGKTTMMKMLSGCHFPSCGLVKIDGISVEDDPVEIKKRTGYLPENNPLYADLSPEEYLRFIASARLIPKKERRQAIDAAIAACGLDGHRNRRIETLSKGYRQRLGLAQAIVHDPDILILDEPTSGLDPNQIIEIRSLIRELGKRKTVILSTHILQEVEAVCSRVLILNDGRIAAQGSPEEIGRSMNSMDFEARDTWELYIKTAGPEQELAADIRDYLAGLGREAGEIRSEAVENGIVRLSFALPAIGNTGNGREPAGNRAGENPSRVYAADGELIFDWAVSRGYKILGMSRKKMSLEDIFVELTAEERSGEPLTAEERG